MRPPALRPRRPSQLGLAALGVALALGAGACGSGPGTASPAGGGTSPRPTTARVAGAPGRGHHATPTSTAPQTTAAPPRTTVPPTTAATGPGDHGPITSPPLPAPGPGFVAGRVTAIGDSVMIDYQAALAQDIPGAQVTAAVSRQWTQGEAILGQLKSEGRLGAVVIVGLGTNGPVDSAQFAQLASILSGASRIVFVNIHVDRTWQDPNNAVLQAGAAATPNAVLANWDALASAHPTWLYPTQTHLPPGGAGAQALAALVASVA